MKKLFVFTLALALTITFCYSSAWAGKGNNGLYGPHWQFNIIGHPMKNKGDDGALTNDNSNGRAIMVPLVSKKVRDGLVELSCPDDPDVVFVDDETPTWSTEPAGGARIYFEAGDRFEIMDRDATDRDGARIMIPSTLRDNPLYDLVACNACDTDQGPCYGLSGKEYNDCVDYCETVYCTEEEKIIAVDVYVRVLGKPNTCMNINGYAYDAYQQLYFWSGRVELARKTGQATWENVNDIFYVWWCYVEGGVCSPDWPTAEISVFNDVFESYFWDVLNDGTRIVQVRLYPVTE